MMIIRTEFSKIYPLIYISHLELMDTLKRTFRRASLPVAYSEGYNPHIKLSVGQPLAVGMAGYSEFFDLELTDKVEISEYLDLINSCLPDGLEVISAREIPEEAKSLQAIVDTANYQIKMQFTNAIDENEVIKDFCHRNEIKLKRKRRNKEDRIIDLKPLIHNGELVRPGVWKFTVSTGSRGNVRPTELVRALTEYYSDIKLVPIINIEREGMLVNKNGKLYKPYAQEVVGS